MQCSLFMMRFNFSEIFWSFKFLLVMFTWDTLYSSDSMCMRLYDNFPNMGAKQTLLKLFHVQLEVVQHTCQKGRQLTNYETKKCPEGIILYSAPPMNCYRTAIHWAIYMYKKIGIRCNLSATSHTELVKLNINVKALLFNHWDFLFHLPFKFFSFAGEISWHGEWHDLVWVRQRSCTINLPVLGG